MDMSLNKLKVGIVAGILPQAAVELKTRLIAEAQKLGRPVEVVMDWEPPRKDAPDPLFHLRDQKMLSLDASIRLQKEGVDLILLPCVAVQKYLDELQVEITTPVLDWLSAIGEELKVSGAKKVGVLKCAYAQCSASSHARIFAGDAEPVPADEEAQKLTGEAIAEIKASGVTDKAVELLAADAGRLGTVDAVLPMNEAVALAAPKLAEKGIPVLDTIGILAKAAAASEPKPLPKPFKLGLIGGLGPAATVDLFNKIVKATPAKTDQEHFKLVIEENPQTPDRTACLLEGKTDPTICLYHSAKRLEEDGCDAIIIPCNTAHAFLPYMKRYLKVPFVDMQQTALEDIATRFKEPRIGLLATSGTIKTGIYSKKAEAMGLPLFTPDEEHQKLVMSAIYGPQGAKAGFTEGVCRDELLSAAEYLVREYACNVLILGCTELPLILDETDEFPIADSRVAIVDPTAVLARKVAKLAMSENKKRGTR